MDNSETHAKAIKLGNELVKLLDLDRGGNTLARWMAYYIAEQIALAEAAVGAEKAKAETNCFNTILKLWQHRSSMPRGMRPFENFDAIFRVLERLDPEAPGGFYRDLWEPEIEAEANSTEAIASVITAVDKAARVLIEQAVSLASSSACSERDQAMLDNGDLEEDDIGMVLIKEFSRFGNRKDLTPEMIREREIERIGRRIETLDWFEDAAKKLRSMLASELSRLEEDVTGPVGEAGVGAACAIIVEQADDSPGGRGGD
ncbi:MAG: hypothetical protein EOP84_00970 [Verrucomicrobiaceae bacterium]|nr:MAG: hypothetical protein EOP84_00970 [Verrucomicrobiaceae bacterium]